MSDKYQYRLAAPAMKAVDQPLLWITGCCVGAVHPPFAHSPESLAWYALEQSGEPAVVDTVLDRLRHR